MATTTALQIELPRAERRRLDRLAKSSNSPKLIDRCRAVLWCVDGKTAPKGGEHGTVGGARSGRLARS